MDKQYFLGHELAGTTPAFFVPAIIQRIANKLFDFLFKMTRRNLTSPVKVITNDGLNSGLLSF